MTCRFPIYYQHLGKQLRNYDNKNVKKKKKENSIESVTLWKSIIFLLPSKKNTLTNSSPITRYSLK